MKNKPGRPEIPLFVYTEKGRYLRKFESFSETSKHYGICKEWLSTNKDKIIKLNDSAFASTTRIGRIAIVKHVKRLNSKYIRKNVIRVKYEEKPIDVYNLDKEVIATFKSKYFLDALLGKQVKVCNELSDYFNNDIKFVERQINKDPTP